MVTPQRKNGIIELTYFADFFFIVHIFCVNFFFLFNVVYSICLFCVCVFPFSTRECPIIIRIIVDKLSGHFVGVVIDHRKLFFTPLIVFLLLFLPAWARAMIFMHIC